MKVLISRYALVGAALAGLALGSIAAAQNSSSSSSASTSGAPAFRGGHRHFARGGMFVGTLLRATRQLNLTAEQKQTIKGLIQQARSQSRSSATGGPDMTVIGNPGNSGFATAVQSMESRASTRIQQESELASSIYSQLTPQQQSQLVTVLQSLQAKAAQRRAAWQARHSGAASSSSN